MSYDLMVFDPAAAPADRESFMQWFEAQTEWSEDHDYDDASVTTHALRAWFLELLETFPAMNGPHAPEDDDVEDESSLTDYSVGQKVIYGAFAWSKAEQAHEAVFELAKKHRLGFFDVSADDGAVWLPDGEGGYAVAHRGSEV